MTAFLALNSFRSSHSHISVLMLAHGIDIRVQVLNAQWFAGKSVLDIGCNTGVVSLGAGMREEEEKRRERKERRGSSERRRKRRAERVTRDEIITGDREPREKRAEKERAESREEEDHNEERREEKGEEESQKRKREAEEKGRAEREEGQD